MRVLLIEDHQPLAEAVKGALARAGFAVDHAKTVEEARETVALAEYDLALLDLGLPDGDGLMLLPALRRDGQLPVIVLTARDQLSNRLLGLDGGADDYVVKPVEMPELVARCRAVLRRPGGRSGTILTHGDLALDIVTRSVTVGGAGVALGRREVAVLEQLMRASGRVAARRVIEEAVYGFDDEVSPNAIEASVSRLRRALAAAGSGATIVTARGIGWMLPREAGA